MPTSPSNGRKYHPVKKQKQKMNKLFTKITLGSFGLIVLALANTILLMYEWPTLSLIVLSAGTFGLMIWGVKKFDWTFIISGVIIVIGSQFIGINFKNYFKLNAGQHVVLNSPNEDIGLVEKITSISFKKSTILPITGSFKQTIFLGASRTAPESFYFVAALGETASIPQQPLRYFLGCANQTQQTNSCLTLWQQAPTHSGFVVDDADKAFYIEAIQTMREKNPELVVTKNPIILNFAPNPPQQVIALRNQALMAVVFCIALWCGVCVAFEFSRAKKSKTNAK